MLDALGAAPPLSETVTATPGSAAAPTDESVRQQDALMMFLGAVGGEVPVETAMFWLETQAYDANAAVAAYYENSIGAAASPPRVSAALGAGGRGRPPPPPPLDGSGGGGGPRGIRGFGRAELARQAAAMGMHFGGEGEGDDGGAFAGAFDFDAPGSGDAGGFEEVRVPGGGTELRPRQRVRPAAMASEALGAMEYDAMPAPAWESVCTRALFGGEAVPQPAFSLGLPSNAAGAPAPHVCTACAGACHASNGALAHDPRFATAFVCACPDWAEGGCQTGGAPAADPVALSAEARATALHQLRAASGDSQEVLRKLLAAVSNDNVADVLELNEDDACAPDFVLTLHLHLRARFAQGPSTELAKQLAGLGACVLDWPRGNVDTNRTFALAALQAAARILEPSKEREQAAWGELCLALARCHEALALTDASHVARASALYMQAMQVFAAEDAEKLALVSEALDRLAALSASNAATSEPASS